MALMDTLEALTAAIKRGEISIYFAASSIKSESISKFLRLCDHFSLEVPDRNHIDSNIHNIEREYCKK